MKRLFLIAALLLPVAAHAQYFDGLPQASALASGNIIPLCQGGTSGVPGTCKPVQTTIGALTLNPTGAFNLLNWNTAGRPTLPSPGAIGFNTSLSTIDLWNGTAWQNPSTFIGGTVPNATTFSALTTFSNGFTVSGGTTTFSNGFTMTGQAAANLANINFLNLGQGRTFVVSGSTIPTSPPSFGLWLNDNISGSSTINGGDLPALAYMVSGSEEVQAPNAIVDGLLITTNTGKSSGSVAKAGSWNAAAITMNYNGPTNDFAGGGAGIWQALQLKNVATQNEGGTGATPATSFGTFWNADMAGGLSSGTGQYANSFINLELDTAFQNSSSGLIKIGLADYASIHDTIRGTIFDGALSIGTNFHNTYVGNRGWQYGVIFGGSLNGPLGDTDSVALAALFSQDHQNEDADGLFVDAREVVHSVDFMRANAYWVDDLGNSGQGTCRNTVTSTGAIWGNCSDSIVTAISINAPGTDVFPGDPVYYDGTSMVTAKGVASVLAVKAVALQSPAIANGGTGGTDGTNVTVTGTFNAGPSPPTCSAYPQFSVDISGGTITVVHSVSLAGSCTSLAGGIGAPHPMPVTGNGLTGAVLNVQFGGLSLIASGITRTAPNGNSPAIDTTFSCTSGCTTYTWPRNPLYAGLTVNLTTAARNYLQVNPSGPIMLGSATETLTTGEIGLTKIAASGSAPGAGGAKMGLVCGTNSGTAKLIMYAGTSSAPVTVVDNIGAGVTGC